MGNAMRSLSEMPPDALQVAHDAAGALLKFRAYLPPGALLVMIVGRFRGDIRDELGMEPEPQLGQFRDSLIQQKSERAAIRASIGT
jgi:hypothetical protein